MTDHALPKPRTHTASARRATLALAGLLALLPGCSLEWRASLTGDRGERCEDGDEPGPTAATILDAIDPEAGAAAGEASASAPAPTPKMTIEEVEEVEEAEANAADAKLEEEPSRLPFAEKDRIRRVVRAHIDEVRACYNDGLGRDPELAGRVVVQFTITGEGAVSRSAVGERALADEAVADCIAAAIGSWTFPDWATPGDVVVNYPFVLEPG
ncbi:MAG: AgmX/PglI C-terminal domain-containing protein [Myxococcales bacterium]|nr:AgmX/PglI C-terminal domain-containing protein [Myxococcales bacterium]